MGLTKIKRRDLKRGDMFCDANGMLDRPVKMLFIDEHTHHYNLDTEVYRIDAPEQKEIDELESELDDARRNQCVCSDPTGAQQLDLLDDLLKIVNITIHHKMTSLHQKNDAFDAGRMQEICDIVTEFRCEHNIVERTCQMIEE